MSLNLNGVRIFAAVAEARSFSRAAATLRVSQPAVSKAVASLEREVGSPLLERVRRGVRVTPAGERLLAHARVIFGAERAAEEELAALRGLERGELHIGASTTVATYMLPPLLGEFHRAHPQVSLRVTSANTRDVVLRLLERTLDVAIVEGPVHDPRLRVLPWREDELIVVAGRAHPLARRDDVRARDLADELMITREPGSGTREVAEQALRRHRALPRRTLEVGGTEAIKQTVAAGLGLAVVSRAAAADQLALGTLVAVPVRDLHIRRPLSRLELPERHPSAAAAAFLALLG